MEEKELVRNLEDVTLKYILPNLVKSGAITEDEEYQILDYKNQNEQREKLLSILKDKDAWFNSLIRVLDQDFAYPWIADILRAHKSTVEKVQILLKRGGVPFKPNHLVERPELLLKIKSSIELICGTDSRRGWVVLYGMPGIGKSVLAAEALRDPYFVLKHFPDGVWWLSVGKSATEASLYNKVQNLYERISKSLSEKGNLPLQGITLDGLSNHLKYCMTLEGMTRCLLVVDDIIDEQYVKYFDIGCPALVTTTKSSLFDKVSGEKVPIKIDASLTQEQAKKLLANYIKIPAEQLPPEGDKILSCCKNFPMELSMVGSYLARFANKESMIRRMKNYSMSYSNPERKRRASGENENLDNAIKMCISQLETKIIEYFNYFVLFTEDTSIPLKVFELLWDLDDLTVETVMMTLEESSLVQIQKDELLNSDCCTIHDMHRSYLLNNCPNLKEMHCRLLAKYWELCRQEDGSLALNKLPNDGYIYYFLAYHLDQAEQGDQIPSVLLDLRFVMQKIKFAGPGDLLNDLSTYKAKFSEREKEREDLVAFIKGTADLLAKEELNKLQLALCQPQTSSVYQKAKELALSAPPSDWYLEWRNTPKEHSGAKLSFPQHSGIINCAVFSPDAKYIASVGDDMIVKVMPISSQSHSMEYLGHRHSIYCCTFSSDGSFLLTSSHDGTVKKWDTSSKNSFFRYPKKRGSFSLNQNEVPSPTYLDESSATYYHEVPIRWCALSSDDKYFVSGGDHGWAQVWNLGQKDRPHVQLSQDIEEGTINHCCFSQDTRLVSTSSHPLHLVHVWDWREGRCIATFNLDIWPVRSSHFTADNKVIAVTESSITCWDPSKGLLEKTYRYRGRPCSITFSKLSSDGNSVVFITSENRIILKDLQRGEILSNFRNQADMTSLDLAWRGKDQKPLLLCSTAAGSIQMWEIKLDVTTSTVELSSHFSARFHGGSLTVASPDNNNCIQIFQGLDGKPSGPTPAEEEMVKSCCLSQDGLKLLYVTKNGIIKIASVENPGTFDKLWETGEELVHCQFIKADTKFVTSSATGSLKIWDLDGGQCRSCVGHTDAVQKFKVFLEEKYLLSCAKDGLMIVWEVETGSQVRRCKGHGTHTLTSCDVTQDGTLLVSASANGTAKLWSFDPASPGPLECQESHHIPSDVSNPVRSCCFSPNGRWLALGNDDGTIRVLEVQSQGRVVPLHLLNSQSEDWVMDLAFSPDSSQLVSVADSIRWWALDSGSLLQTFHTMNPAKQLAICPDFRLFTTVDDNGVLYILERILPTPPQS